MLVPTGYLQPDFSGDSDIPIIPLPDIFKESDYPVIDFLDRIFAKDSASPGSVSDRIFKTGYFQKSDYPVVNQS